MKKSIALEFITALFILLFTYASVSKLLDYHHFRIELGKSPILAGISGWLAWILPIGEIMIAILLASRQIRWMGLYLSFTLMVMFTTYLLIVLHFSSYVPCTCGGILEKMTWNTHILFNAFFIVLAILAIMLMPARSGKPLLQQ